MGNREGFELLSIDKYFESEENFEVTQENGEKKEEICKKYEFDASKYDEFMTDLVEKLKEITQHGEKTFIVVDAENCDLKFFDKIAEVAKENLYELLTIELHQELEVCLKYNDHCREVADVEEKLVIFEDTATPEGVGIVDPEYLYALYPYQDLMDLEPSTKSSDAVVTEIDSEEDFSEDEAEAVFGPLKKSSAEKSKWDDDADKPEDMIERLDGIKNKNLKQMTMADYLKPEEDEWTMRPSESGKKRVRWADIEEKKEQERMKEVGFIVGQTDWKRMMDTSDGKSALEKTKYIESRKK